MFPELESRQSDSPMVARIWRSYSESSGSFTSISAVCWSLVFSKLKGRIGVSLHGPETGASCKDLPSHLEWFGIDFKMGAFMPCIPPESLVDGYKTLPDAADRSFYLNNSAWQFPNYENADTFVDRLVRERLLVFDPVVHAIDQGYTPKASVRTVQYRFLHSTGLSHRTIQQIERARYAATLLKQGAAILDTAYEAGYSDQSHLTRSLKHFIGTTPAEIPATSIVALHTSE